MFGIMEIALITFLALLPISNPFSTVPLYLSLTKGQPREWSRLDLGCHQHGSERRQFTRLFISISQGILAVVLVAWLSMRGAPIIARFLGVSGLDALTRIMGFILICIAFQFVLDGLGGYIESDRFLLPVIEKMQSLIN